MRRDREEGFDYPVANPDRCLGCGKCDSVCPVKNQGASAEPLTAMAVRCEDYVGGSSSGGVFPALAKVVTDEGGLVFGAVMERDLIVGHAEAETMEEVQKMRGSKYVQSDPYSSYMDAEQYLKDGRKVLFTGTPCQIAGLKRYLSKDYDNLLTVDTACHGVPGPGLWEMYTQSLKARTQSEITCVRFRDKSSGWRHYTMTCIGPDGQVVRSVSAEEDPYMALFMQGMTLRPSCYRCPSRGGRSCSDLTFSDLWSVASSAPQLNDDKGVSGVLVNSEKGADLLSGIQLETILKVPVSAVKAENSGFAEETAIPEKRAEFFQGLGVAGVNVYSHMKSYVVRKPLHERICRSVRSAVSSIKRRVIK
jgi:coenzyme F420-reducing hydrogenase beta subunit